MSSNENILIYAIRGTDKWWKYVGKKMGPYNSFVVSDIKGKGDFDLVDDFYEGIGTYRDENFDGSFLLPADSVEEIIARFKI